MAAAAPNSSDFIRDSHADARGLNQVSVSINGKSFCATIDANGWIVIKVEGAFANIVVISLCTDKTTGNDGVRGNE